MLSSIMSIGRTGFGIGGRLALSATETAVACAGAAAIGAGIGFATAGHINGRQLNAQLDIVVAGLSDEARETVIARTHHGLFQSVTYAYGESHPRGAIIGRDTITKVFRDFRAKYNSMTLNAAMLTLLMEPVALGKIGPKPTVEDLERVVASSVNDMAKAEKPEAVIQELAIEGASETARRTLDEFRTLAKACYAADEKILAIKTKA